MIYAVECSFADPDREAEWNAFYSRDKLPALISVPGFHTSQRFQAISPGCPTYLALHSIDGLEILTGAPYREKGGGNFARWQDSIRDWRRTLYGGLERMPAVAAHASLAISDTGPEPLNRLGAVPIEIQAVALDQNPTRRWLAVIDKSSAARLTSQTNGELLFYAPMTEQLRSDQARTDRQE